MGPLAASRLRPAPVQDPAPPAPAPPPPAGDRRLVSEWIKHRAEALAAGQPLPDAPRATVGRESSRPSLAHVETSAGPVDAGVPLPAGVVDVYADTRAPSEIPDHELWSAYAHAEQLALSGDGSRKAALEDELDVRAKGWAPAPSGPAAPANTNVRPEVGFSILENVSKGEPPFKPELGKGKASWFVTEGNPHTGTDASKNVRLDVKVDTKDAIVFREAELGQMYEKAKAETGPAAEAEFRRRAGIPEGAPLNSKLRKSLVRFQERYAETKMWDRVAERVGQSKSGVGEVILEPGSDFSKTPGKFAVVSDAKKVKVEGGAQAVMDMLDRQGLRAEPGLAEAATKAAKKAKNVGKVKAVFHHGGRVLLVVGATMDAIDILTAKNKPKAIVTTAGGWAGASAGAAACGAAFAPADAAGPLAWIAHGLVTVGCGAGGYVAGKEVTRWAYDVAFE